MGAFCGEGRIRHLKITVTPCIRHIHLIDNVVSTTRIGTMTDAHDMVEPTTAHLSRTSKIAIAVSAGVVGVVLVVVLALIFVPHAPLNYLVAGDNSTSSTVSASSSAVPHKNDDSTGEDCSINNNHPVVKKVMAQLPSEDRYGGKLDLS